jgi:hypothetical protein
MDTKFKAAKKEKLPAPAKEAKTFMDALALVRFPTIAPMFSWFFFYRAYSKDITGLI